jgi:hypothetical protein
LTESTSSGPRWRDAGVPAAPGVRRASGGGGAPATARAYGVVALLLFVALVGWLLRQVSRPEVLPVGSPMPPLRYVSDGVARVLAPNADGRQTVVVLFHTDCESCRRELATLELAAERVEPAPLVFLSPEPAATVEAFARRWPALARSGAVRWGATSAADLDRAFGRQHTPTHFLFGPDGRLRRRLVGEAPLMFTPRTHSPNPVPRSAAPSRRGVTSPSVSRS